MTNKQIEIDFHKLQYHPERVSEWKKTGDCYPIYIEIGPTNRCNHRCSFCALDWIKRGGVDINKDIMLKNLDDMAMHGVKSIMFAGEGEPLLHKNINLFITTAKESGMDVAVTTNGVLFDKERAEECLPYLSWIRFSVDAGTRQTYARVHRTKESDFDKVIANIQSAAEIKKRLKLETTIGVQFLLIPENMHEAKRLTELIRDTGADNIQIKPYSQHPLSKNLITVRYWQYQGLEDKLLKLQTEKFRVNYRKQTIERLESERSYDECRGLTFFALITARGQVVPCNMFYDNEDFVYGNINEQPFSEIWDSPRRQQILQKVKDKGLDQCRHGCRLDAINRYLHRIKNPQEHDNFI